MKILLCKLCICIVLMIIFISCHDNSQIESEQDQIKKITETIDACIGWFKTKDFDLLFSVVAHDSNFLSVHPTDKIVRGYDEFLKNAEIFRNPDFIYKKHELKDLKITMSKSGDVAWFYCKLNDMNTWKGQPANWENTRWTGVLEKRDNHWNIVQQHFSFAATN